MLKKVKIKMVSTTAYPNIGDIVRVDQDVTDMMGGNLFDEGDLFVFTKFGDSLKPSQNGFTTQNLYAVSTHQKAEMHSFGWNPKTESFIYVQDHKQDYYKIIATTDGRMNLLALTQDFVNLYCSRNGKGLKKGLVDHVEDEYSDLLVPAVTGNTVQIQLNKKTYTRKEVQQLLSSFALDVDSNYQHCSEQNNLAINLVDGWLEKN